MSYHLLNNRVTILKRKEKWWFHAIRGLNYFVYRNWWFVLLIFIIICLTWYFFCFKNANTINTAPYTSLYSNIDKIDSALLNCCDCQSDADIEPCNMDENMNGGKGYYEKKRSLGNSPGTVVLKYNLYDIPDKLEVLYNGNIVATTGRLTSGVGSLSWYYAAKKGEPIFCTIVITAPKSGTSWQYFIECPQ